MSFIAVDLGTSFIKGAVLDLDARRIEHIQRVPFPDPIPGLPALYREFDLDTILSAVCALLDQLAPFAENCEGLVMCSQMHGLVFCTERGEARSHLTTWLDQRVLMPHPAGQGTYFDVLRQHVTPEEFRQLGNELRPGLPVGLVFWQAGQGQLPPPPRPRASDLDRPPGPRRAAPLPPARPPLELLRALGKREAAK